MSEKKIKVNGSLLKFYLPHCTVEEKFGNEKMSPWFEVAVETCYDTLLNKLK